MGSNSNNNSLITAPDVVATTGNSGECWIDLPDEKITLSLRIPRLATFLAPTQIPASFSVTRQEPVHEIHTDRSPQTQITDQKPWCIYKVPHRLREVNEKAYEPNVISIGPYHYGKQHLRAMQVIKKSSMDKIFQETHRGLAGFRAAMRPLEPRVRACYEQPLLHPDLQYTDKFLDMMILDGCFIVQLIRKVYPDDDIFKVGRIQTDIHFDLLLLENQIPFFLVFELYRLIVPNAAGGDHAHDLVRLALSNLLNVPHPPSPSPTNFPNQDIKHLLHLAHSCFHPSPLGIMQHQFFKAREPNSQQQQRSWKFIRSATELEDAGINFFGDHVEKMKDQGQGIETMFDITFTKDTKQLKIPTLAVSDSTERLFRNYMAYEQFIPSGEPTYFVDYVVFMDNLINTGKDVQLLCENGVIDNWLGDDEAVAQMFNKLRDSIYISQDFYYAEIFGRVNEHCRTKWNKWKAGLRKDYFNTPWSLISFLAALFLLILTILQTIFSVLSYF